METRKAIFGRRAVREYEEKQVPEKIIKELLEAGAMAPSAMDAKPCRFLVITDRETIRRLSDKAKDALGALGVAGRFAERLKLKEDVIFYGAPLLILIFAEKGDRETDCALAAQNMMLMAYDLGLGSCYIGLAGALRKDRRLLSELGARESQELYGQLIFGYPKKWPEPKTRKAELIKAPK